jgi:hypothetical protein
MLTTTFPFVAPFGTTAVTLVLVQFGVDAGRPLKVTVPVVPVKLLPAIAMEAPGSPLEGVRLVIVGATITVKFTPLLATPPAAVTTTLPETAPEGTTAVMLLLVHPAIVAEAPPNVTALPAPWALKFDPAIVTEAPTAPVFGVRLVMLGADVTVNVGPAGLETPPAAVTTTDPVVAPAGTTAVMLLVVQLVIDVAGVPLNFTPLPVPCVLKFVPAMVTEDAIAPELGARLEMLGAGVTVKFTAALVCPPTVTVAATLPVGTPEGTGAVILVEVHTEGTVAMPLNLTPLPLSRAERKLEPAMMTEVVIAPMLGVRPVIIGGPVARDSVILESKFPFSVPSKSNSPLKVVEDVAVRFTPTHK